MRLTALLTAWVLINAPLESVAQDAPDPELIALLREAASEIDSFPDHFDAQVWLTDMSARLERQGFDLWQILPGFSDPASGRLLQFDGVFYRV